MEILVKNISDIIVSEVNSVNDTVRGLNYLEILKVNIIEKCLPLIIKQKFSLEKNLDFEKNIDKDLFISIKYFSSSLSISKKNIDYDSLFVSFNESTNFDIYKDEKKYTSILLHKNNGISVPRNSIVNLNYNKYVLLLELQNKNTDQVLTK